ncbi:MAG: hypothetical protein U0T36_02495 [Saprospiraceae bacterium]
MDNKVYPISIIGHHNLQNMNAARLVCAALGIDNDTFFASIADFSGTVGITKIIRLQWKVGIS